MADFPKKRIPADETRINVDEEWEVRYWCNEFNCTKQELREAVREVGVMADDVRMRLKNLK